MNQNKQFSLKKNFSSEKTYRLTLIVLACFGVVLRLRHYLANRSLWLDEAMLAINILDRSFVGLTQQPMEYEQGAPIGFIFFVKAATLLFGSSEYSFRLYSFLASCVALLLMIFLAKHYLNKAGTLLVVALFASGTYLVYYSAETKQYMGDVVATLLLLFLFEQIIKNEFSSRKILFFSFINAGLLWFSHAAVFVVIAIGATLSLHYARQKDVKAFWFSITSLAVSGISAIFLYIFHIRPLSANHFLNSFWEEAFMPFPLRASWFQRIWDSLLFDPLGLNVVPLFAFILFIFGFIIIWRKNWLLGLVSLLTFLLVLGAAAMQKYPVAGRMLMFTIPFFFLLFGAGIDGIISLLKRKTLSYGLVILFAGYLLYSPIQTSFERLRFPLYREHISPTMAYLGEHLKEDDLVYVYYYAEPAFLFYLQKYHLENSQYTLGQKHQDNPNAYLAELDTLQGKKRVWVIFSHVYEKGEFNEKDFMLNYLNQIGEKDREYRVPGTSVYLYLYDLR